jgi:molybdenum cofactor biosynthesis protein B
MTLSRAVYDANRKKTMNPSPSTSQHKAFAAERGPVAVAIVTVSDSRTPETDTNAHYLRPLIEQAGHRVAAYHLIKDEPAQVTAVLEELARSEVRIILFNGGTGISTRDTTYDALSRMLEKTLPGFGELFRMLSYEQVGAAAMLSRATAGVYRGKVVISTPGSPAAVQLAWEKLIAPELAHLAWEVAR